MKPKVKFNIENCETDEKISINFYDVETIDSLIESLEEARAELEHKIEMERLRNREKKQRKKLEKEGNNPIISGKNALIEAISEYIQEFDKLSNKEKAEILIKEYFSIDENFRDAFEPYMSNLIKMYKAGLFD